MATEQNEFPQWKTLFAVVGEIRRRVASADKLRMEHRTLEQANTFDLIAESYPDGILLKELARRRGVTPGTASTGVESLVRAGAVRRVAVDGDRRSLKLLPTAKALRHIASVSALTDKIAREAFAGISASDRAAYLRVLRKVSENLSDK